MTSKTLAGLLAGAACSTLIAVDGAQAQSASAMTTAGTTISNTASVAYTVNGTAQTTTSTTANFVVARKVNFTVVRTSNATTSVNLGQSAAYIAFRVTNTTNGTQDFLLDPDQANYVAGILPGTPNFQMLNFHAYVDVNGNGVYDPGVDTRTYIDELAPDASATVFLVGDVPTTQTDTLSIVDLHVTAAAGGATGSQGAALVATDLLAAASPTSTDVVFADDDDDGIGPDIIRNGQGRAYAAYQVNPINVALTVTKTALVISDPVNLLVNPRFIPGATVQYCLSVNNATIGTAASNVVLTDVVPTGTTLVANSITIGAAGGTCNLLGSSTGTSYDATSKTVTANVGTVNGGATIAAAFQVTIN